MTRILLAIVLAIGSCTPKPIPVPVPPSPSAGGSTATGGTTSIGGSSAVQGGASSIGGSSATSTVIASVQFPVCNQSMAAQQTVKRSLSGWHRSKDRAKHRRLKVSYSITAGSVFNAPNVATPLDQLALGSCTGNATAQCLSTWPFKATLTESDAVKIYSKATAIDSFPGVYPPTDSGSDGQSAAKAAKLLGYTTLDFAAIDTVEGAMVALQKSALIIGVDWYDGFFNPTKCGEMQLTGAVAGGHEIEMIGWDAYRKVFWIRNSWGPSWGVGRASGDNGYAYWSTGTLQRLLTDKAEIDGPVLP